MKNSNSKGIKNIYSFFVFINQLYVKVDDIHLILQLPKTFVSNILDSSFTREDYLYLKDSYWVCYDDIIKADEQFSYTTSAAELKSKYFSYFKTAQKRHNELIWLYEALVIAVKRPPNVSAIFTDLQAHTSLNVRALVHSFNAFSFFISLKTTTVKECFLIYCHLVRSADEADQYYYKTKSLDAFKTKVHRFRTFGLDAIIHKYYSNQNASVKYSQEDVQVLKKNLANGNLLTFRETCREINMIRTLKGQKHVSVQSVISKTKGLQEYGKLFIERQGSVGVDAAVKHPKRTEPKFPGDLYQADGSKYSFPYRTEEGKVGYLMLIAVIDVFSRKITGYTLSKSENFAAYFEVFKQSILETNTIPAELVIDNHRCLHSATANIYFEKLRTMGAIVRHSKVGNKQDKSYIENFFNIFNMLYSKKVNGYQGESVLSKRVGARPNEDERKYYTHLKNLRSRRELEILIKEEIELYNCTYEVKNSRPQLLFANSIMQHAIVLDDNLKRVLLFEEKSHRLLQLGISFEHNKETHEYLMTEEQVGLFLVYVDKNIVFRFDPQNLERIYLYKTGSYTLICELERHKKIPSAAVSRTAEDNARLLKLGLDRIAIKRKLNEAIFGNPNYNPKIPASAHSEEDNAKIESINVRKQVTKLKPLSKSEKIDSVNGTENFAIDKKVLDLKLALSGLFKVSGSNKAVN